MEQPYLSITASVIPKVLMRRTTTELKEGSWLELVLLRLQEASKTSNELRILDAEFDDENVFSFTNSYGVLTRYCLGKQGIGEKGAQVYTANLTMHHEQGLDLVLAGVVLGEFLRSSTVLVYDKEAVDFKIYGMRSDGMSSGLKLLDSMGLVPKKACHIVKHPKRKGEFCWDYFPLDAAKTGSYALDKIFDDPQ